MKAVYVAGAYSGDTITTMKNIHRGISLSIEVLNAGLAPFCPWLDCLYWIVGGDGVHVDLEMIQAYSMEFLKRCDYVLLVPGYENSNGTKAEIAEAGVMGIPVYTELSWLIDEVQNV